MRTVCLVVAVLGAAAATGLSLRPRPTIHTDPVGHADRPQSPGWARRGRLWWALSAGLAGLIWLPGAMGAAAAVGLASITWLLLGRAESPEVRRAREAARAELPHLVSLLATVLRAGGSPETGLGVVTSALPGPGTDRLTGLTHRLSLGADPSAVWALLAQDPVLAPLGRSLARAHESGASVADAVERLAGDLGRRNRADAEDRARAVGVRAAVPLGLCLLPSFLLIGVVPVIGGLMSSVLR